MRSSFEVKFPEIVFSDDEWSNAVDLYPCFYGAEWDVNPCDDKVILYLLAHLIIIIQRQQNATGDNIGKADDAGYTQSKSVGSVSVSKAVVAFSTVDEFKYGNMTLTSYGKFYLTLLNNINNYGGVFV